ncbi:hypothetical protein K3172_14125 [Qipengyuania sp. 6B39]|uniref:hypothetical protein n=1 Tax=Qipengyuania proteolytica TaxID=2867239 RepID=UPI001C890E92|nr:hypothetical protein [Qipengyuania proteolytica]MBX7496995.1 hypothetical protein [Qipengyuania proteolytica]
MTITREDLAAFADGELSGEREAEVAAAIAADPALALEVEAHRALKAKLAGHFAPIAEQPVPEALAALLQPREAEVVDFAAARERVEARRRIPRWGWVAGPALAASLALALFLPRGGSSLDEELVASLDNQLVADQAADAETRILLSFRNRKDELCRAYTVPGRSGISCKTASGWEQRADVEYAANSSTDFRQASTNQIFEQVQEMAEGPALDAQAEAEAKANGWRR